MLSIRPFAALLPALLLAACGGGEGSRPHVLLITVDTLRADRLSCYGYQGGATPHLDALAAEGVRFERAYSHAPFTAPSHASLLTSLHTQSHGVLAWEEQLTPEASTLGERFGAAGYRTAAFYNHPGLKTSGIVRGFDTVELRYWEEADATIDAYLAWLDGGEGPTATWMHLWDVHRPYGHRDWTMEWIREYVPAQKTTLDYEAPRSEGGDPAVGRTENHYNLNAGRLAAADLSAADLAFISERYDGGVRYADGRLGRLFDALRERGALDRMVVVVTSDHGESLTERDSCFFTHDPFLHEETLRVPLLLRLPGGLHAGTEVDLLARGVDVLPTILEACDVPVRGDEQGRSLLPAVRGEEMRPLPLFAVTQTKNAKLVSQRADDPVLEHQVALCTEDWKVIWNRSADAWHLYDLRADPGEKHDLAGDPLHRMRLKEHRDALLQVWNLLPKAGVTPGDVEESVRQALGHGGYTAGPEEEGAEQ